MTKQTRWFSSPGPPQDFKEALEQARRQALTSAVLECQPPPNPERGGLISLAEEAYLLRVPLAVEAMWDWEARQMREH